MRLSLNYGGLSIERLNDLAGFLIRAHDKTLCIDAMEPLNCYYKFFTHNHPGHFANTETMTSNVFSPFTGNIVRVGDELRLDPFKIKVLPAYNITKVKDGEPIHPRGLGVGYMVEVDGVRVYHMGDTDLIPELSELRNSWIDILLVPIGGVGVMTPEEAAEAVMLIRPRVSIPMHFRERRQFVKFRDIAQPYTQVILL